MRIFSAGADKFLFEWDCHTMKKVKKFKGHTESVNSVAVSDSSDSVLGSGSDDMSAKLWDTRMKGPLMTF